MPKGSTKKVAFISSFNPRKCGIATFTSDLIDAIKSTAKARFKPLVVAMKTDTTNQYSEPVKFEIRQDVKNDYICAADYLNFSHVDLVCVQHEFGLFGGNAGSYLNLLLSRLNAPVITTLHTVLDEPTPDYYQSTVDVCNASHKVITMNTHGITMLRDIYGINEEKIKLIPHGIPDLPFVDSNYYKHKFNMDGRKTILTFGLLSKNKGIEVMLKAMPQIVKSDPTVLYVILGMTHPLVLKHDGESYRFSLQRLVKELDLNDHVIFYDHFVQDKELDNFLCAADVYVTPYLHREQLTSGTLSYAVGTGRAVISTPYWAAEELLSDGRGVIVPFNDHKEIAKQVINILKDESLFYSLRRSAYEYGRNRTWPKIGHAYWKSFNDKALPVKMSDKTVDTSHQLDIPEPSLDYVKKFTDDTGMFQHAKFTIPNRWFGYTTDDNARAVIAMLQYYDQYSDPEALRLCDIYLAFLMYAQDSDGNIRNVMDYDKRWIENEAIHDALGRTLWAFGALMAHPPTPEYLSIIKDFFDRSIALVQKQYPRAMAYVILGMSDYLKKFPGASDIKRHMTSCADLLLNMYQQNKSDDWLWFEDELTYDNAVLPQALFIASQDLSEKYYQAAKEACDFLVEKTYEEDHFSFVGCNGWYPKGGKKAKWDQQPIEAVGTVLMLNTAYEVTKDRRYLALQRKAFDWFLGDNDLKVSLYDFRSKGCYDGLTQNGVNLNQGAESLLSFLMAQLTIIASYTASQPSSMKPAIDADFSKKNVKPDNVSIREISSDPAKDIVEQPE